MRLAALAMLVAAHAVPAAARSGQVAHLRQTGQPGRHAAHAAHRIHHAGRARPQAGGAGGWGTTVYGTSLPSISGTCVDPYDPDPIGGPDRVGAGGPGGYGPQCRTQAGVIPGTTLR